MAWLFIIFGGVLEIGFTTCLRYTDGFRNIPWTVAFILCISGSMFCLQLGTKVVPLGTAYAVWTGIGALGTVLIGMLWYNEPATIVRGLLICLLIGAIAGLKLTSSH